MAIDSTQLPIFGEEKLYTRDQLAYTLGITRKTLWLWATTKIGPPYHKIGSRFFYKETEVRAWLEENKGG